jgi:hypothetical protein
MPGPLQLPFRPIIQLGIVWAALCVHVQASDIKLKASSGGFDRTDAVVKVFVGFEANGIDPKRTELPLLEADSIQVWQLQRLDKPNTPVTPVEVRVVPGTTSWQLIWVEPGQWPAGQERQWTLKTEPPSNFQSPWKWLTAADGQLELHHAQKGLVFRYNQKPINQPGLPATQLRGAYIHPFLTPSGKLATGDFSPAHTHHRGFFLAYAKTKLGDGAPDFWNIHAGTAKIVADQQSVKTVAGPVTAGLLVGHDWQLRDKSKPAENSGKDVLEESWNVSLYDIPGQPAWVWDIKSSQKAVGQDLELVKHRYGGMAYRGPEPFVKGKLDVLTSEGNADRKTADQKPARWIDLTGPVADGSTDYVGAVMCDHPSNLRFPNVVRIHPVTLPFFSFVPAYNENLKLKAGVPYTWQYRTMVHDGHPDKARNDALFKDFAHPVQVHVESVNP